MKRWLPLLAATPFAFVFAAPPPPKAQAKPVAKRTNYGEVAPIFKAHCTSCHGGTTKLGGLKLDTVAAIKKGGINEGLIVPGKPEKSLLVARIKGHGGKPRMPMGFAPLTTVQTKTVEDWIAGGASFDGPPKMHWSYVAPKRPAVPTPKNAKWVRNPIDAFVMARLERGKLMPSPEAPKEILLRRASLDLIGLPPTPAEIDAFLADKRPGAYERAVDRLLASPHYGERQARVWLDLARYADTDGYEKDLRRTAWKYRDWLIGAFNRNLPYDQFTVEQIGGDLLPKPTQDQLIATGFNRNTLMNLEGGVDQEEAHFKVILDRVDTTATVWLGSTVACARCHDHKYDPFSQKDYYKMAAFFNNAAIYPRGPKEVSEEKWFEADMEAPSPEQAARKRQLETKLEELEARLKAAIPGAGEYDAWRTQVSARSLPLSNASAATASGSSLQLKEDGSWLATGHNPAYDTYTVSGTARLNGVTGLRLEALTDATLGSKGPGRSPNGNFVINRVTLKVDGKPVAFRAAAADFVQSTHDASSVIAGDRRRGWAINGQNGRPHELVLEFAEPVTASGDVPVEIVIEQQSEYANHTLGRFRVGFTQAAEPASVVVSPQIGELVRQSARTEEQEAQVLAAFRATSTTFRKIHQARALVTSDLDALKRAIPTALVMRDRPAKGPLKVHLRTRGEFLSRAEEVPAGTIAILPKMKPTLPGNRLGLAQWLVSRENPLTARVQVNRMWEVYFGRGLVETSDDFGTQGSKPSHPELLDWLAVEFMDRGWDMKAMHRLIVTSATYRQSSNATKALIQRDPENVLLARGPRFRLEAEAIRDVAMTASGLLDRTIGGPSVFPHQPEGVWDSPYSGDRWTQSQGKDAQRRAIYTFWKRTATFPGFTAFDATSRETCTVRRIRTNTPLQALAQLNDRGLFEAAKALAERMRKEGGTSEQARLAYGFRLCTGRQPKPKEVERLAALVTTVRQRYEADPKSAERVGGTPEQAAWTIAANVLLNLDETITKG